MSKYKFSLSNGILWTAGLGLMCVGLDAILALWISVMGSLLILLGVAISASTLGLIGLLMVVLTIVLYSFTKEE